MAYLFNLWNFYQLADKICEFDVTPANLPHIKDGTKEFITACLQALSVTNEPAGWSVRPFRGYYFSEYVRPGQPWQGRWDIGWTVRVDLSHPLVGHVNALSDLPVLLDATDATWIYGDEDPRFATTAIVISVHRESVDAVAKLATEVFGNAMEGLEIRTYQNGLREIRAIFDGVSFPEWIDSGDSILDRLRRRGGGVNFREWDF